jgi:hypothetical protein
MYVNIFKTMGYSILMFCCVAVVICGLMCYVFRVLLPWKVCGKLTMIINSRIHKQHTGMLHYRIVDSMY